MKEMWTKYKWWAIGFVGILGIIGFYFLVSDYKTFSEFIGLPGKSIWDFIDLLVLPLLILFLTKRFQENSQVQSKVLQKELFNLQQESNKEIFNKEIFNTYIDKVNTSIKEFYNGNINITSYSNFVIGYSYSVIQILDSKRIGFVFDFLQRNGLLRHEDFPWSFINYEFRDIDFYGIEFINVTFNKCKFIDCKFRRVLIQDSVFNECFFTYCAFDESTVLNSQFAAGQFGETKFNNCTIEHSRFIGGLIGKGKIFFSSIRTSDFISYHFIDLAIKASHFISVAFHGSEFIRIDFDQIVRFKGCIGKKNKFIECDNFLNPSDN